MNEERRQTDSNGLDEDGEGRNKYNTPKKTVDSSSHNIKHHIVYNHNQVLCGGNLEEMELEDNQFVRKKRKGDGSAQKSGSKKKSVIECCICYSNIGVMSRPTQLQ